MTKRIDRSGAIRVMVEEMPSAVRTARGKEPVPPGTDPGELLAQIDAARRLLLDSGYLTESELKNLPEEEAVKIARQRHRQKYGI